MKKRESAIVLIISIILIIYLVVQYKSQMSRYYPMYLSELLHAVKREYVKRYQELEPASLPKTLPDTLTAPLLYGEGVVFREQTVFLADPFNKKGKLLKANGATRDYVFSYSGAKLTYKRLSDRLALVYSYGPDLDDDIGNHSNLDLTQWVQTSTPSKSILDSIYDPTNGLHSNGDIVQPINIEIPPKLKDLEIESDHLTDD